MPFRHSCSAPNGTRGEGAARFDSVRALNVLQELQDVEPSDSSFREAEGLGTGGTHLLGRDRRGEEPKGVRHLQRESSGSVHLQRRQRPPLVRWLYGPGSRGLRRVRRSELSIHSLAPPLNRPLPNDGSNQRRYSTLGSESDLLHEQYEPSELVPERYSRAHLGFCPACHYLHEPEATCSSADDGSDF